MVGILCDNSEVPDRKFWRYAQDPRDCVLWCSFKKINLVGYKKLALILSSQL